MKIDFKKGNGASYLGLMLVILVFVLTLCFVDYFNLYNSVVVTQTRVDAITDAMAVAANDDTNVPNVTKIEQVKTTLTGLNNNFTGSDVLIDNISYDHTQLLKNKLLVVEGKATTPFINSIYYRFNSSDTSLNTIHFKAKNKTKILISSASQRKDLYPTDCTYAANPKITCSDPSTLTPELYRNIVLQFEVELTERYKPQGNDPRDDIYLWDVTRALGCELPYYYVSQDGSPWVRYTNGHINDNGQYAQDMWVIDSIGGYREYCRKYLPNVSASLGGGLDICLTPMPGHEKWKVTSNNDASESTLEYVQQQANEGHPTVLLYANGSIEIVVPEIEHTSASVGLFVSYASSVPDGVTLSNANMEPMSVEYKIPFGNFIAITYYA